jgi:hypothetical protein
MMTARKTRNTQVVVAGWEAALGTTFIIVGKL